MRDDWTETTLNELLVQIKEPVKVVPNLSYRLLGVRWYGNGPFIRETVTNKTSKATRLFPVQVGDFIYNRLFAWKGSFGLITKEFEGCFVSSEFPLFRVRSELLDGAILNLIMCQPSKWAQIEIESTGSTSVSRNRWKEDRFLEQVLRLPPIDEQKRIVDVVSSVDAYIDALQQHFDAARTARNAVLHELLTAGGDDWTETTLGELCEIYQPETISKAQMNDAAPYIVYGANGPVGRFSRFNHEEPEVVVTCRGATCGVVNMTPPNCWITGNAMVVRPRDERSTKGFLFWALQTSVDVSATISGSAQPQITRTGLAPSKIQVPSVAEQRRIVEIVSSMDEVIQAAERAVVEAKNLRSGLLSDLLSGEHEIPVSYDELLGAA